MELGMRGKKHWHPDTQPLSIQNHHCSTAHICWSLLHVNDQKKMKEEPELYLQKLTAPHRTNTALYGNKQAKFK